ncbi:MAG: hypothetical protein ACRDDL_00270 [Sarcina sp.]
MNKQKVLALIVGTTMTTGIVSAGGITTTKLTPKTNIKYEKLLSKPTNNFNVENAVTVYNESQLTQALKDNYNIILGSNITITSRLIAYKGFTNIQGNNHTLIFEGGQLWANTLNLTNVNILYTKAAYNYGPLQINDNSTLSGVINIESTVNPASGAYSRTPIFYTNSPTPTLKLMPNATVTLQNTFPNDTNSYFAQNMNITLDEGATLSTNNANIILGAHRNLNVSGKDYLVVANNKQIPTTDLADYANARANVKILYFGRLENSLNEGASTLKTHPAGLINTWNTKLTEALKTGTSYQNNIKITQTQINNVQQEIDLIDSIYSLQNQINTGKNALTKPGYTTDSTNILQDAIKAAENITSNINSTAQDVSTAMTNLQNAIKGLVVNTANLQKEINSAKEINTTAYTSDSVTILQNAIKAAENVVNNKEATVQDVSTAMTNLQNAIKGLVVNTANLQKEINSAKEINTTAYTSDSVTILQNAIKAAENVVNNKEATVQDVSTAMTNLQNAIKNLVQIQIKSNFKGNFWEDYGLVINGNLDGVVLPKNVQKELIIEGANGQNIAITGANVNWFSQNKDNYSGYQFILTATNLHYLDIGTNFKMFVKFTLNGKVYQTPINLNQEKISTTTRNYGFNLINQDNDLTLISNPGVKNQSVIRDQYNVSYGTVINVANNFDNKVLEKDKSIYLVIKNSEGQPMYKLQGANVNWFDISNYSGAQFILPNYILNRLKTLSNVTYEVTIGQNTNNLSGIKL